MEQVKFDTIVSFKLRQIRTRKGVPQDEIAEVIGVSQSAYSNREMARVSFGAWELYALAEYLEVQLSEILPFDINMEAD